MSIEAQGSSRSLQTQPGSRHIYVMLIQEMVELGEVQTEGRRLPRYLSPEPATSACGEGRVMGHATLSGPQGPGRRAGLAPIPSQV